MFRLLSLLTDREFTASRAALLLGTDQQTAEARLARLAESRLLDIAHHEACGDVHYGYRDLARIYARTRLWEVIDDPALSR